MSLLYKPKIKSYRHRNPLSELMSSPRYHNACQQRDDSSNSSLEQSEQGFSRNICTRYYTGVVKSFNIREGYGFIACSEMMQEYGCDVFMHKKQFFATTVSLRIGDSVRFRVEFSKQGKPQARELTREAEAPVEVLRRLRTCLQKTEAKQFSIQQPKQISTKRKRKVSFKDVVEVCEVNEIFGDESNVDERHEENSPRVPMKEKHINAFPAKKFSSLLMQKEAKQNSSISKIFTGEKKLDTCLVDRKETSPRQVNVTPNKTIDNGETEEQTLDISLVDLTNSTKMQTKKVISPRLAKRVISKNEYPETSELTTQGDKKTDDAAQSRLEEGVINGLLRKTVTKEAASIISKKDSKKVSNRKKVTFSLVEDIIDDSQSCWISDRPLRQNKKRIGMMKNFGATVRRRVKKSPQTGGSIECSRSEDQLVEDKETELARLARETFEKLQQVQKKSNTSKVTLQPKIKSPKNISGSNTDPAYLDWSLAFGEEESSILNEPKTKGQESELLLKDSNVQSWEEHKIGKGQKKMDPGTLRESEEWFPKPPVCRNPRVAPSVDWGSQEVLMEMQERERECTQSTLGGFFGFREGCSLRRDDQEYCSDDFDTYGEERHCNGEIGGQILNQQQTQPVQCKVGKKAVRDQSPAVMLFQHDLPMWNYQFPRPLDVRKQSKQQMIR